MVTEADNDGVTEALSDDRLYQGCHSNWYSDGTLGMRLRGQVVSPQPHEMPSPPSGWLLRQYLGEPRESCHRVVYVPN